jgi:hypothetical protein
MVMSNWFSNGFNMVQLRISFIAILKKIRLGKVNVMPRQTFAVIDGEIKVVTPQDDIPSDALLFSCGNKNSRQVIEEQREKTRRNHHLVMQRFKEAKKR